VTVKVLYVDFEDGELVYVVCESLSTTADGESSSAPEPATASPSTAAPEGWCNEAFIYLELGNMAAKLNIGESVASVCRYVIVTWQHAFNKPHSQLSMSVAHGSESSTDSRLAR